MIQLFTLPLLLLRLINITVIGIFYFFLIELLRIILYLVRGPEVYKWVMENESSSEYTWVSVCNNTIKRWWYNIND